MFKPNKSATSLSLSGYTLIIPAVSVGNVGQLAVDVLLSSLPVAKIGYLHDANLLPSASNDALEGPATGSLTLSAEVFQCATRKLAIVQQRAPTVQVCLSPEQFALTIAVQGRAAAFAKNLCEWAKTAGFARIILLSSAHGHKRIDQQLAGRQFRYFLTIADSSLGKLASSLRWPHMGEIPDSEAKAKQKLLEQVAKRVSGLLDDEEESTSALSAPSSSKAAAASASAAAPKRAGNINLASLQSALSASKESNGFGLGLPGKSSSASADEKTASKSTTAAASSLSLTASSGKESKTDSKSSSASNSDEPKVAIIQGGGITRSFYQHCLAGKIELLGLVMYANEGDNAFEGIAMARIAEHFLALLEGKSGSAIPDENWRVPSSWKYVFGTTHDDSLYE